MNASSVFSKLTLRIPSRLRWMALPAIQLAWAGAAHGQLAECSSCNRNIPCDQKVNEIFMNEDGKSASAYVRVCGPGQADLPTKHATLIAIPAASHISHVCVGARSVSQFAQNAEVFYAGIDPLTGLPELEQGHTSFALTNGDNHHVVPVNWSLGGTYWVGVRFPAGACSLAEQGVRPRMSGDAAVWISGDAWRRYDFVGNANYNGNTPVIRLIAGLSQVSPPLLIVNPIMGLLQTDETGGAATFDISLSRAPCDTVFVNVDSLNPLEGVVVTSMPLRFDANNWNAPQSVAVEGVDDPLPDGHVHYPIEIYSAGSLADYCYGGLVAIVAAINIDDESLAGVDCDGNGLDDSIDIAIDPSLDADGDGQIDGCATYLLGDLNCDLQLDGLDVPPFTLALISPADYQATYPGCNINAADMNSDGVINLLDRVAFIQALVGP